MNKLICSFLIFVLVSPVFGQSVSVADLTCEYRNNPLGVEKAAPALSWKLKSPQHGVVQTAYQILVAENLIDLNKNRGTIWDSKKINSAQSLQVTYGGKPLKSTKQYFWKVRVWNNKSYSAWSVPASWQMGLLTPADWLKAKWIAYERIPDSAINVLPTDGVKDKFNRNNILPIFRKEFKISKAVKKATLFISGLGHFEASLNGQKIGDHFLDPGWTKYDKEALYVTFDVSKNIKKGYNAIGVMVGNGFYYVPPVKGRYRKLKVAFGYPKMMSRLFVEFQDGTVSNFVSDETWKTSESPITFSSIYGGEDYNANLFQKGWDLPGFTSKKWREAVIVDGPSLKSQKEEPVKLFETFAAVTVNQLANGDFVYDMGQNASAIIELKVKGKKGDTIRVLPAELINPAGSVNQKPVGSPVHFNYVLNGDGVEVWRPRFTYYGFRYLQVKGAAPAEKVAGSAKASIMELKSLHVRNAAPIVGSFSSSNQLFNQTFNLINWAIKSNMVSLFTDCPQREKLGWLEELHLMGSSVRYNFDVAPLFRKSLQDMKNSQTAEGLIPEIAPEYVKFEWGGDMFRDSPEWGSSSIIMPWYLYQWYGDRSSMEEYYPMMKAYINYLEKKANGHILSQGLGDWYDLGPKPPGVSQLTPMGITATAIYYHDLSILNKIATMLGKSADALNYQKLGIEVKNAFNKQFFNKSTQQYGSGSQAANAMALYMKLVEDKDRAPVLANLIKNIRSNNNGLTAGDIGYRYVLRVLEEEGRSDVIFDMNSRSDVPGYGMQIAKGATALTESWAALTTVSNNHFMLGHLMEWFYSGVGGIRLNEQSVAFKQIIIYPEVVGDLTSAKTSYNSPYGEIVTDWHKSGANFNLNVSIPANTTAVVYLPFANGQKFTEKNNFETKTIGIENGRLKIEVGSGNYQFTVQ